MVSNENSDFRGKVFLKADPKIAEFHYSHYFVVVLNCGFDVLKYLIKWIKYLTDVV